MDHRPDRRAFTGIPSITVATNGRIWCTWYCGKTPGEDDNSYVVLATSGDGGETWKEFMTVDPDGPGPLRAYDSQVWAAPDGTLRWSWSESVLGGKESYFRIRLKVVTLHAASVEVPHVVGKISDIARGVMLGKPIVLSDGAWGMPIADWSAEEESSGFWVSSDAGANWTRRGGATVPKLQRCFDEHYVVEMADGRLWCLSRTMCGPGESYSSDGGRTWTKMTRPWFNNPNSRMAVAKLRSGNVLIAKHGPMMPEWKPFPNRERLWGCISKDDGRTWGWGRQFEIEPRECSYPDIAQGPDGTIYVVYDHGRTSAGEILFASFREEDILNGDAKSPTVRLRRLVTKSCAPTE